MKEYVYDAAYRNDVSTIEAYLTTWSDHIDLVHEEPFMNSVAANVVYYGKKTLSAVTTSSYTVMFAAIGVGPAVPAATAGAVGIAHGLGALGFIYGTTYGAYNWGDNVLYPKTFYRNGWTLLHFAGAGNALEVASFLVEHGANATLKDASGRTFIQVAENAGHHSFVRAIRACIDLHSRDLTKINNLRIQNQALATELEQTLEFIDNRSSVLVAHGLFSASSANTNGQFAQASASTNPQPSRSSWN